ncbi:hypothetical protein H4Q26_002380 [Puccinia striiformis f. sp. tritici PST-130]|nr:hypothetical protein Pst134EB_016329 [Puccinia striiformis f. sp. tritici]KAI9603068.1 hypothetical protein H4Q26_002380 [Puccinia striiformis f. sp. tritici PST-130]
MVLTRSSYSRLGTPLASPLINNPNSRRKRLSLASSSTTPPGTPSKETFTHELTNRLAPCSTTNERQCSLLSQSQTLPCSSFETDNTQSTTMNDLPQNNSLQIIDPSTTHQTSELGSMLKNSQENHQLSISKDGDHLPENQVPENQVPENQLPENQLPENQLQQNQAPEKEVEQLPAKEVEQSRENGADSLQEKPVTRTEETEETQTQEKEVNILQEIIVLDSEEEEEDNEIQEITREKKEKATRELDNPEESISKELKTSESTTKEDQELTKIVVEPNTDSSSSLNPSTTDPMVPVNH